MDGKGGGGPSGWRNKTKKKGIFLLFIRPATFAKVLQKKQKPLRGPCRSKIFQAIFFTFFMKKRAIGKPKFAIKKGQNVKKVFFGFLLEKKAFFPPRKCQGGQKAFCAFGIN